MNYSDFFNRHNIEFQEGLSDEEFVRIKRLYGIEFPFELREMLKQALPVSEEFYNWRDYSDDNVELIMKRLNRPFESFYDDAIEVDWNEAWGEKPADFDEIQDIVRDKLAKAPKLIPIYSHRYIPMLSGERVPVFSICDIDIIIYGKTLEEYFEIEFGERQYPKFLLSDVLEVPFWSEVL